MKSEVMVRQFLSVLVMAVFIAAANSCTAEDSNAGGYEDLLALFEDWSEFEQPPVRDGACPTIHSNDSRPHTVNSMTNA